MMFGADLTRVTPTRESRAVTFENPTGAPGNGGRAHGGRKGSPYRMIESGERLTLVDVEGPGVIRHIWMTVPPAPPELMRAYRIEVFYEGADEPSLSVPAVDFFGVPWGRPVALNSSLVTVSEGRGFNSWMPMPFRESFRLDFVNDSPRRAPLYFQVDYTLEAVGPDEGYLHATYRRQNPTSLKDDFVILEGLRGPGRFLGCVVGVRVLDRGHWYGEGEVKMYVDADDELPSICGTGLEDYVGTAWAMGPHQTLFMGAPLIVAEPESDRPMPDFVGFYRWHVADPVMFAERLKVTIQQIGFDVFLDGEEESMAAREPAGAGWLPHKMPGVLGLGTAERVDDYCATAFVMCQSPQPVPRPPLRDLVDDVQRLSYETPAHKEGSVLQLLD